ncbi:NAD(P)H-quinone oxidoreductase, partial [Pseudoxanthomonas sp. SGD-10]
MKAAVITQFGDPEVIKIQKRDIPSPKADEVLIKIYAAGINRPDIMQRQGKYPPPVGAIADIPGLEVAGEIVSCGSEVTKWQVGDKVCALISGGGYAEYTIAHEGSCLPIPSGLSLVEAASLPETIFTVWYNVFMTGKLKAGESILIHGGSSGIGVTAIQLAKNTNARVFVTAGTKEKCSYCLELGADKAINYKEEDFFEVLKNERIDVILDMVGGDYTKKNISLLNTEGRLIMINAMKGAKSEINLLSVMTK